MISKGMLGRLRPVMAVVMLAVAALAITPGGALAHAKVAFSTPTEGATVPPGLTRIDIRFSEDVSPEQSSAQLFKGSTQVSGVTSTVDRADRTKMAVSTPALDAGQYQVRWQAVTEDDN